MRIPNVLRVVVCVAVLSLFVPQMAAAPHYSSWSTPVNLGAAVNSSFDDYGGALSKNGLSLYFTSTRPGGSGGEDLWVSQRSSTDDSFGPPVNLGPLVNGAGPDRTPALSRDGHWLFFASTRPDGFGGLDVWAAYRDHTDDDFAWLPPVNLGPGINTSASDTGPTYLEGDESRGARLYFARGTTSLNTDIWVSEQAVDGTWGAAVPVAELNTSFGDAGPDIRHDGLEILFHSTRPGSAGFDVWVATRETPEQPFSAPVNAGTPPNSAGTDRDSCLSSRADEMILSSDRPGGFGGLDLYVSARTKRSGN